MVTYGANIENLNLIVEKSKDKNDGVYTFRGVVYVVHNRKMVAYCSKGSILRLAGNFSVAIGSYDTRLWQDQVKASLKSRYHEFTS